ncbi:MAG: FMN-binding protein, partial [Oceanobacter sp.]
MDQSTLAEIYPYPYSIGERDETLAAWPLLFEDVTGVNPIGYVYESINFSSIPGFMGVPYNLLVAIDLSGTFLDVRVLYHREPMFMGGVGEIPMKAFADQYIGLSLTTNLKFRENPSQRSDTAGNTYIDGISGATASVRVLNQTLLSSALKIARAKLGFGVAKSPDEIARIDLDKMTTGDWPQLLDKGLVHHAHQGEEANLYVADLMIPSVGRNLLPDPLWQQ